MLSSCKFYVAFHCFCRKYEFHCDGKKALKNWALSQKASISRTESSDTAIRKLLSTYVSDPAADTIAIKDSLEALGVYILPSTDFTLLNSGTSDVRMSAPMISYDAANDEWLITFGGYWLNDSWHEDYESGASSSFPADIGGTDIVGIVFSDVSNYSDSIVDIYGFMNDGKGTEIVNYNESMINSGLVSVAIELQDYVHWDSPDAEVAYVGEHFGGIITYASNFVNCSGNVSQYYVHTYKDAHVSGLHFSANTGGIGVEIDVNFIDQVWCAKSTRKIF